MKVYVIQVVPMLPTSRVAFVSQEAYGSLKKAQAFIESRSDTPSKISAYWYRSTASATDYLIYEVNVV